MSDHETPIMSNEETTVTAGVHEGRAIKITGRPWFRPAIGVFLLVVILVAAPVYGRVTAGGKISPDISRDREVVDVIVDLSVDATTFHREELSNLGVFGGGDRTNVADRSRVRMLNVTQSDLVALSRLYWVSMIEPL